MSEIAVRLVQPSMRIKFTMHLAKYDNLSKYKLKSAAMFSFCGMRETPRFYRIEYQSNYRGGNKQRFQ